MWRVGGVIICCMLSGMVSATNNQVRGIKVPAGSKIYALNDMNGQPSIGIEVLVPEEMEDGNDERFTKAEDIDPAMGLPNAKIEYKNYIDFCLLRTNWEPNLRKTPTNEGILKEYPGGMKDAIETFEDPNNMYKCHNKPFDNALELLTDPQYGYDSKKESIFFPRSKLPERNEMFKKLILALAMRNLTKKYNIFLIYFINLEPVIWKSMSGHTFGMLGSFPEFAEAVGKFFDLAVAENQMQLNQVHILGWCWVSVLCGHIGQYLRNKHNGKKIKSILALDPHTSGISQWAVDVLTKDDAEVVMAFHTNSLGSGTFARRATLDIVFNDGSSQPGCGFGNTGCNHERVYKLLWWIILYPDLFYARRCTWAKHERGFVNCRDEDVIKIPFPPQMPPEPIAGGTFFIDTVAEKPYGRGLAGTM